jgi:dephospho-CoA kinase
MMIKIGVTGNIGSGKTVVCDAFIALGIPVFNSDQCAKIIVNNNQEVKNELASSFGSEIYASNGLLDRIKFADLVFGDKESLSKANSIIHPHVRKAFSSFVQKHFDKKFVIQEAAVLFENNAHQHLDKIILVTCPVEERIARVMSRDGSSRQKVESIIRNQWPEEKMKELADYIVQNADSDAVLPQILSIYNNLVQA